MSKKNKIDAPIEFEKDKRGLKDIPDTLRRHARMSKRQIRWSLIIAGIILVLLAAVMIVSDKMATEPLQAYESAELMKDAAGAEYIDIINKSTSIQLRPSESGEPVMFNGRRLILLRRSGVAADDYWFTVVKKNHVPDIRGLKVTDAKSIDEGTADIIPLDSDGDNILFVFKAKKRDIDNTLQEWPADRYGYTPVFISYNSQSGDYFSGEAATDIDTSNEYGVLLHKLLSKFTFIQYTINSASGELSLFRGTDVDLKQVDDALSRLQIIRMVFIALLIAALGVLAYTLKAKKILEKEQAKQRLIRLAVLAVTAVLTGCVVFLTARISNQNDALIKIDPKLFSYEVDETEKIMTVTNDFDAFETAMESQPVNAAVPSGYGEFMLYTYGDSLWISHEVELDESGKKIVSWTYTDENGEKVKLEDKDSRKAFEAEHSKVKEFLTFTDENGEEVGIYTDENGEEVRITGEEIKVFMDEHLIDTKKDKGKKVTITSFDDPARTDDIGALYAYIEKAETERGKDDADESESTVTEADTETGADTVSDAPAGKAKGVSGLKDGEIQFYYLTSDTDIIWIPYLDQNKVSKEERLNENPQVLKKGGKTDNAVSSTVTTYMHATAKDAAIPGSTFIWKILYFVALALIVALFIAVIYYFRYERDLGFPIINTVILIVLMIVTLYPVLNTVAYSFSSGNAASRGKIGLIPQEFTTKSYRDILDNYMLGAAWISVAKTVLTTVLNLFWTGMLAFTLTRKEYVLAKPITLIMVLTMYVNAGLILNYLLISQTLGLKNTFWVYIIPTMFSCFNMIIIRTYIASLPGELVESARIDGAGDFRIYWQIIFPLCAPVLATVALFIAVGSWNSWFDTMLYNADVKSLHTLQYVLKGKIATAGATASMAQTSTAAATDLAKTTVNSRTVQCATTVVTALPILIIYPFLQKYFVTGMALGSVKG